MYQIYFPEDMKMCVTGLHVLLRDNMVMVTKRMCDIRLQPYLARLRVLPLVYYIP